MSDMSFVACEAKTAGANDENETIRKRQLSKLSLKCKEARLFHFARIYSHNIL